MSKKAEERIQVALKNKATSLDLSFCDLTDLPKLLGELTDLKEVKLNGNKDLSDLGLLARLHNLAKLEFTNTNVNSLNPIANLAKLVQLEATNTKVNTLISLADLRNLKDLSVSSTNIKDLSPLTQLKNLETLYIYNTQVIDLEPLRFLKSLKALYIYDTQVSDLKPLSQLTNLEKIYAHNTKVSDLTPLSNLLKLKTLFAHNTQITNLDPLSQLKSLETLYIYNTRITNLSALSQLEKLSKIHISNTKISDLSPLKALKNLITVDLSYTKVYDLNPLKRSLTKKAKVKNSSYDFTQGIYVKGCPLSNPPVEIIEQGTRAILRYWLQIETQKGTVELYEAKLIIVGEGGTGKTTLFEKLKDPTHEVGNTSETHGINIHEGLPFQHQDIGSNTFYANLWDFGGQQLQYMTHQFFLTPRALYVLMMDARRESPNLTYWFKIISLLGRESADTEERVRLLLVFNKRKNSTGQPQYQDTLKFYEDSFDYHFLEVDFAINDYRFENLRNSIYSHLVTLPIVKSQLPRLWKDVREDLRAESKKADYISTQRFAQICSRYDIEQEEDQWLLSGYLHQLGSLLHFQNDRGLRSWIILNPQWAVDGVYCFLTNDKIVNNYGHFDESDFILLLADKGYSKHEADLILQIMTKNNFDICYEANPGRYVAAQLLPDIAPEYNWFPKKVLQFRYQYPIMPKGLMSRLIVRLSDDLDRHPTTGKQIVWKKGGVFSIKLREGECRVRLREDDAESQSGLRQILIDVMGVPQARKYALHKIRDTVDDLHKKWFRSLKVDEMVPCCCSECFVSDNPQLFKLENLLKRSAKRNDTSCDYSGEDVLIQTLLEGIYDHQEIRNMTYERDKFPNR